MWILYTGSTPSRLYIGDYSVLLAMSLMTQCTQLGGNERILSFNDLTWTVSPVSHPSATGRGAHE